MQEEENKRIKVTTMPLGTTPDSINCFKTRMVYRLHLFSYGASELPGDLSSARGLAPNAEHRAALSGRTGDRGGQTPYQLRHQGRRRPCDSDRKDAGK